MMGPKCFSTNFRVVCDSYASVVYIGISIISPKGAGGKFLLKWISFKFQRALTKVAVQYYYRVLLIVAKDMDFGISPLGLGIHARVKA